jgi:hypothetical protein
MSCATNDVLCANMPSQPTQCNKAAAAAVVVVVVLVVLLWCTTPWPQPAGALMSQSHVHACLPACCCCCCERVVVLLTAHPG